MLWADQLRGTDGTGVAYDMADGLHIVKAPASASEFSSYANFKTAMDDATREGSFLVGHNRAATKGNCVWKNTHPFTEGHITLMHNGTLWDHDNLDKTREVDSHAICSHMSQFGAEKTLEEIDGAFALIWVDEKELTVNLARNDERPLHLIETGTSWIISSELGLGLWMAERAKMAVLDSFELEKENIYTFSMEDFNTYKKIPVTYRKAGWSNWKGCWPYHGEVETVADNKKNKHNKKKDNVIPLTQIGNSKILPFGSRIKFSPWQEHGKGNLSCIIFDDKQAKNFLLGKVYNEPNVEIRVYDTYKQLQYLSDKVILEGTIVATTIKGSKVSYRLENVGVIAEKGSGLLGTCEFCADDSVPIGVLKKFNGFNLCPLCYVSLHDNPKLAQEVGFVQ